MCYSRDTDFNYVVMQHKSFNMLEGSHCQSCTMVNSNYFCVSMPDLDLRPFSGPAR